MKPKWRLIIDDPVDGYSNMSIDESIMRAHADGIVPPTIRFFQWHPACVSLGYFQSAHSEVDLDACRRMGIDFVRRPTGGRAILHDAELTYSVVAGVEDDRVSGSIPESYRKISAALLLGLEALGVAAEMKPVDAREVVDLPDWAASRGGRAARGFTAACFDVPSDYEIAVRGRKLIGSAQTRHEGVLLQHGSLLFDVDAMRIFTVLKPPPSVSREAVAVWLAKRITSLQELLGRQVAFSEVARKLCGGFAERFGVRLEQGSLSQVEIDLASSLRREKYATAEWNLRR